MAREHTLYEFNPYKFVETCFMAQNIICLDEYSMCTWNTYLFCCWVGFYENVSFSHHILDMILDYATYGDAATESSVL